MRLTLGIWVKSTMPGELSIPQWTCLVKERSESPVAEWVIEDMLYEYWLI